MCGHIAVPIRLVVRRYTSHPTSRFGAMTEPGLRRHGRPFIQSAHDVNTLDTVLHLAAQQFGGDQDKIDPDAPIQQLGADSLGYLEFLFELEGHFNIVIEQDAAKDLRTLRDLSVLVDRLREAAVSQPG